MNLSMRKNRGLLDAGANRPNDIKNRTSHRIVYTVLIGNSAGVNRRGKSETCPETAKGLNALRYRRSFNVTRLKGMMTRRMAFS